MSFGIYVHIPFCKARCGYCDFVTFTGQENRIARYPESLIEELDMLSKAWPRLRAPSTIFFGGGTPSLLDGGQVAKIISAISARWDPSALSEVTLEANPESVSFERASAWRAAGVNRLSMGLQSFDDALLKKMGRLHTADEFRESFRAARRAGFGNMSIDLIYGFEGQTPDSWRQTVRETVAMGPDHVSIYALAVEEHTPFAASGHAVDADAQAEMYEWARIELARHGLAQYEISNFSKPGFECRHNLIYWRQQPYLGAGVGAVGCVDGARWQVHKNFQAYHASLAKGEKPWASVERLDDGARRFERLMLGLRLRDGFEWAAETDPQWIHTRERLRDQGLLEEHRPGVWRVAEGAVALTNQVLLPFM